MPNVRVPRRPVRTKKKVQPAVTSRRQVRQRISSRNRKVNSTAKFTSIIKFFTLLTLFVFLMVSISFLFFFQLRSQWNSESRLNVVIIQQDSENSLAPHLTLLSVDGRRKQAIVLPLPSDLKIDLLAGRGQASVYELIAMMKEQEFTHVQAIIGYHFGFVADGWLVIDDAQPMTDLASLKARLSMEKMSSAESSLMLSDRLKIWKFVSQLRTAHVRFVPDHRVTTLSDDGRVVSTSGVNEHFASFLSNLTIQKQNINLGVVNTTQLNGIATRVGTVFSQIGFRIVNISSKYNEPISQTILYVSPAIKDPDIVESLQEFFPFPIVIETSEKVTQEYRSDIVLMLGEDMEYFSVGE